MLLYSFTGVICSSSNSSSSSSRAVSPKASERGTKNSLHSKHPCREFRARKSWQILRTVPPPPLSLSLSLSLCLGFRPSALPSTLSKLLHSYHHFDSLRCLLFCIFDKVGNRERAAFPRVFCTKNRRDISF